MRDPCFSAEEIAEIVALPADHPTRHHLADCPRCRALAMSFREFMYPGPLPAAADAVGASRELATRLGHVVGPIAAAAPRRGDPPTSRRSWRPGPQQTLLAAAAVLIVCAGIFLVQDLNDRQGPHVPDEVARLRGPEADPTDLEINRCVKEDGWLLTWQLPADADDSRVVLFDRDLVETASLATGTATELTLLPGAGHAVTSRGDTLRVSQAALDKVAVARVEFLRRGDVIGQTGVRTFPSS